MQLYRSALANLLLSRLLQKKKKRDVVQILPVPVDMDLDNHKLTVFLLWSFKRGARWFEILNQ